MKGQHFYVACLKFYEKVSKEELSKIIADIGKQYPEVGLHYLHIKCIILRSRLIYVLTYMPFYGNP